MATNTRESGPMSGFRDFPPEAATAREAIIAPMEKVYQQYGYGPLVTPAFEASETILGQEGDINKQVYRIINNDGGVVGAARFDHTVPLARYMAANHGLTPLPFRRYANGPVWRGERPGAGRYREFVQFDADIVGEGAVAADIEALSMMMDAMDTTKAEYYMRVNDRRVLDSLANVGCVPADSRPDLFRIIDKTDKIGEKEVLGEININFGRRMQGVIEEMFRIQGEDFPTLQKLNALAQLVGEDETGVIAVENLQAIFGALNVLGRDNRYKFDPTIARGLGYYTGMVFETNLADYPELGSVCSGGRYDRLIKDLGGPDMPAVGASIGIDRLMTGLEKVGIVKRDRAIAKVLVTYFGNTTADYLKALAIADGLRKSGISVILDSSAPEAKKRFSRTMKYADRQNIGHVVLASGEEGGIQVKDMATGEQTQHSLDQVTDLLKLSE